MLWGFNELTNNKAIEKRILVNAQEMIITAVVKLKESIIEIWPFFKDPGPMSFGEIPISVYSVLQLIPNSMPST